MLTLNKISNLVDVCELPKGVQTSWRWPKDCSVSMERGKNVQRCEYLVNWKWMNGMDVAQFTLVTPFIKRKWSGIQFLDDREKVKLKIFEYIKLK
jgi:hypothetical protein